MSPYPYNIISIVVFCPRCNYFLKTGVQEDAVGTHGCMRCGGLMEVYIAQGSKEAVNWQRPIPPTHARIGLVTIPLPGDESRWTREKLDGVIEREFPHGDDGLYEDVFAATAVEGAMRLRDAVLAAPFREPFDDELELKIDASSASEGEGE